MSPHQSANRTQSFTFVSFHHVCTCFKVITTLGMKCQLKNRLYPLIGLIDDIICESLRHLAGSVLGSLQRVIQEALGGGGYHRGNERSDSSCCLGAQKKERREKSESVTYRVIVCLQTSVLSAKKNISAG